MIRAVYLQGTIQPLDSVPADWRDGQELEVIKSEGVVSLAGDDQLAARAASRGCSNSRLFCARRRNRRGTGAGRS